MKKVIMMLFASLFIISCGSNDLDLVLGESITLFVTDSNFLEEGSYYSEIRVVNQGEDYFLLFHPGMVNWNDESLFLSWAQQYGYVDHNTSSLNDEILLSIFREMSKDMESRDFIYPLKSTGNHYLFQYDEYTTIEISKSFQDGRLIGSISVDREQPLWAELTSDPLLD